MATKIDPKDLGEIVEETARLEEESQGDIEREQARQILRELDLPASRLEEAEALVSVRREKAKRRAHLTKVLGVGAAVAVLLGGTWGWRYAVRARADARMTAIRSALSVGGKTVSSPLLRGAQSDVRLEVVLDHPVQGAQLDLRCDWTGPSGELRDQNRWQTKTIDKDVWTTHCHRVFGPSDPAGEWSVVMRKADRSLAVERFKVE